MNFKNFAAELKKLLQFDKQLIKELAIFAIVLGALELTVPFAVQAIINRIYKTYLLDPLLMILIVVTLFLIIQSLYLYLRFTLVEFIERKVFARIAKATAKTLNEEKEHQNISMSNRFFEAVSLKKSVSKFLTGGLSLCLSLVFGFAILLFYHPFFAVLIIFVIASFVTLVILFHKKSCETSIIESKKKYLIADEIDHIASEDLGSSLEKINTKIEQYLFARDDHFKLLKYQYLGILSVYIVSHLILLGVGGMLVLNGELSIGQLVASELIFSVVLSALSKSVNYLETYYDSVASIDKLSFVTEYDEQKSITYKLETYNRLYRWTKVVLISTPIVLALLPWVQTSEGMGFLTTLNPADRVQEISALVDGRIDKWFVKEGDVVVKGQPIVEIVDNDPQYVIRLKTDRDAAFQKYEADKMAAETALLDFERQKSLFDQGLTSRVKFEKAKINYHKLIAKEAEAASKLAQSEVKFARQQRQIVTAPSNGIIQQLLSGNTSSIIKKGTQLAIFVPESNSIAVEIFVDGNDVPLIHKGRTVQLEFEGFPAFQFSGWPGLSFGTFKGQVASVDSTVSKNGKFRVMVIPEDIERWPNDSILRRGAKVMGWVQMNTVSVAYEIWRQFNGFPATPDELAITKQKMKK